MLNVYHYLVHRQVETFCHSLYDSDVGLMRHNKADVVLVQVVAFCNECAVVAHVCYGIAEHCASLLVEVVQTVVNREV